VMREYDWQHHHHRTQRRDLWDETER
jgi:hypothetical protein